MPGGGAGDGGRQRPRHRCPVAAAQFPESDGAGSRQGGDRRGELDGVVRVEDAFGQAERPEAPHAPQSPEKPAGPPAVRTAAPAGEPQPGDETGEGKGDQPRNLAAHDAVEHPPQAGHPTEVRAASGCRSGWPAARTPEDPGEPVVAEDQADDRVVGGAADVGPGGRRPQGHDGHPPTGREHERGRRRAQLQEPLAEPWRPGDEVDDDEGGQDQERLQHLGVEGQACQPGRHEQPSGRGRSPRPTTAPMPPGGRAG